MKRFVGGRAIEKTKSAKTTLKNYGSTSFHLDTHLQQSQEVNVYTHAIALIGQLGRSPGVLVFVLDSEFGPNLQLPGGAITDFVKKSLTFELLLQNANTIDEEGRRLINEAEPTGRMATAAMRKFLLPHQTECLATSQAADGSLRDFDPWVTLLGTPPRLSAKFKNFVTIVEALV